MFRVCVLGIGSHTGFLYLKPAAKLRSKGFDIDVLAGDSSELDADPEKLVRFMSEVRGCGVILVAAHGDATFFRHWDAFRSAAGEERIPIAVAGISKDLDGPYGSLFTGPAEERERVRLLMEVGGDANLRSALIWCLKNYGGRPDLEVPPPDLPPAQGVYVPGRKEALALEEGLKDVGRSGRPAIMILFVDSYYVRHNTDAIDFLYDEVRKAGGEPVCVFLHTYPDPATGSLGISKIVDTYLLRGGRPIIDAVINTMGFSLSVIAVPGCGEQKAPDDFLTRLGVPVIQAVNLYGSADDWKKSPFGLSAADIAMSVVSPEYDGDIDGVPYCGTEKSEDGEYRQAAIPDRCEALAEMAVRWARLRRIPEKGKKVAILIYMYPPRQDLAGGGYGLDTMESVCRLLAEMRSEGYSVDWVPEGSRDLADRLLAGITNDDNWHSDEQMRRAAVDLVSSEQYAEWFSEIPEKVQKAFTDAWGEPPGDIHTLDRNLVLPGIMDGNVFIGFQPDRGKCTTEAYHDPDTAPPHQYLAFYRWLKDVWKADAIIHVGTHGTLEWLPGKSAGLSSECDPDIILSRMPNINPYIIDNPGEGMQSKRRQFAVTTTHLIPAMARSGGYDSINRLELAVQQYLQARGQGQTDKLSAISSEVRKICAEMNMLGDLGLSPECSEDTLDAQMDRLYDYILEAKDATIKDGLHILGKVPEGKRMAETVYMLVRSRNGDVPSLRESVAHALGYELEDLLRGASAVLPDGRTGGQAVQEIDDGTFSLIEESQKAGFDTDSCLAAARRMFPRAGPDLEEAVRFMCGFVVPAAERMGDEIGNIMKALDGGFVPPGPSGCPNRGRAQILPTGRNFYSIDPDGIPWKPSWDIGSAMAEQMVGRYVSDHGVYPRSVGVVLWSTDTMKTGGDDVSYILKLMGLRPVWADYGGRVTGLEVIPLSELKRPRVDVTVRISGLFRDTFPNLCVMIDDGVRRIAELDEDDEDNYLAANVRRDTVEAIEKGIPSDRARREASFRVFGDAPGVYGGGVSELIQTGRWESTADLGEAYLAKGGYVYGRGQAGEARPDIFRKRLSGMDATVKNHNTRAVDMLDMDDDMDYLGGFSAAVEAARGQRPESYMGDSSDTQNLKLRTSREECAFIFRSKIDNPKWLDGLKAHGFAGAKELSKLFDYTMGWSGTSGIVEQWMYTDLAERFVLDKETREWIKDVNPYAMAAMLARLYEAKKRGFWDPDDEMLSKLKDVYLEFEEKIEEITDS